MRLPSLLAAVPCSLFLACQTVATKPPAGEAAQGANYTNVAESHALFAAGGATAPGRSAGDASGTVGSPLPAAELAALRAEGPPALARLLAAYDAFPEGERRATLAATIDKVAGQRYATHSRLYWYDDLAAARAAARASGKPILSLRMLGRLDEDLSCANSRFFRTTLYPDAAVAALLRDRFILHWSSERNAPRITIDYGDGRKLESTVTGNSAHYILDAEGRPIDVLPGLYAPQVFVRELKVADKLHAALQRLDDKDRAERLVRHHQAAMQATEKRFADIGQVPYIVGGRQLLTSQIVMGVAASAQRATMSKAFVEVPMLRTVNVGVDPGKIPDDVELWAEIGQQLLGVGDPPDAAAAAGISDDFGLGRAIVLLPSGAPVAAAPAKVVKKPKKQPLPILDDRARALVDSLLAVPTEDHVLNPETRADVIARLEQTIVADTAINEVRLRRQIRGHLIYNAQRGVSDFAELNTFVYDNVFHTPSGDAWMGLLPRDTFTGLPAGAVVTRTKS